MKGEKMDDEISKDEGKSTNPLSNKLSILDDIAEKPSKIQSDSSQDDILADVDDGQYRLEAKRQTTELSPKNVSGEKIPLIVEEKVIDFDQTVATTTGVVVASTELSKDENEQQFARPEKTDEKMYSKAESYVDVLDKSRKLEKTVKGQINCAADKNNEAMMSEQFDETTNKPNGVITEAKAIDEEETSKPLAKTKEVSFKEECQGSDIEQSLVLRETYPDADLLREHLKRKQAVTCLETVHEEYASSTEEIFQTEYPNSGVEEMVDDAHPQDERKVLRLEGSMKEVIDNKTEDDEKYKPKHNIPLAALRSKSRAPHMAHEESSELVEAPRRASEGVHPADGLPYGLPYLRECIKCKQKMQIPKDRPVVLCSEWEPKIEISDREKLKKKLQSLTKELFHYNIFFYNNCSAIVQNFFQRKHLETKTHMEVQNELRNMMWLNNAYDCIIHALGTDASPEKIDTFYDRAGIDVTAINSCAAADDSKSSEIASDTEGEKSRILSESHPREEQSIPKVVKKLPVHDGLTIFLPFRFGSA